MKVRKFQVGGAAPAPEEGAQPGAGAQGAQGAGPSPEEQLAQMAQQIIQQLGPEAAAALAQMIVQMLQEAQAPAGQPTYQRKGGKLVMIGRR